MSERATLEDIGFDTLQPEERTPPGWLPAAESLCALNISLAWRHAESCLSAAGTVTVTRREAPELPELCAPSRPPPFLARGMFSHTGEKSGMPGLGCSYSPVFSAHQVIVQSCTFTMLEPPSSQQSRPGKRSSPRSELTGHDEAF